ncbi:hypothetical protein ACFFRR_009036 [Megaselia abdita]
MKTLIICIFLQFIVSGFGQSYKDDFEELFDQDNEQIVIDERHRHGVITETVRMVPQRNRGIRRNFMLPALDSESAYPLMTRTSYIDDDNVRKIITVKKRDPEEKILKRVKRFSVSPFLGKLFPERVMISSVK